MPTICQCPDCRHFRLTQRNDNQFPGLRLIALTLALITAFVSIAVRLIYGPIF